MVVSGSNIILSISSFNSVGIARSEMILSKSSLITREAFISISCPLQNINNLPETGTSSNSITKSVSSVYLLYAIFTSFKNTCTPSVNLVFLNLII
jgi:hypothetical protein